MAIVFRLTTIIVLLLVSVNISATEFNTGPVFSKYGENAIIEGGLAIPTEQSFKVMFDIADSAAPQEINRQFNSVARFINMHVRAGVPFESLQIAMVVHGDAAFDVMSDAAYQTRFDRPHAGADLLNQLMEKNVDVYVCGQSASHKQIITEDLMPGVELTLSAMTASALLQQQGYTLNPF